MYHRSCTRLLLHLEIYKVYINDTHSEISNAYSNIYTFYMYILLILYSNFYVKTFKDYTDNNLFFLNLEVYVKIVRNFHNFLFVTKP